MSNADRFPDDFFVEALRGKRRPPRSLLLRRLANRAAWLQGRITSRREAGQPFAYFIEELAAIVLAIENLPADPGDVASPLAWADDVVAAADSAQDAVTH